MSFKDYFSKQSGTYARYRPTYPAALFDFLVTQAPHTQLAWDCGTGNGQCAVSLAQHFEKVQATDPSAEQIKNAQPNPKVIYKVEQAEKSSLQNETVDLITIAQALHWFNFNVFYAEARRVLKKNGIIAAWAYGLPVTGIREIDELLKHFHNHTLSDFWQYENRLIEKEYVTIPFPFTQVAAPDFYMHKNLSAVALAGLLRSWSATQRFIDDHGFDPVTELEPKIQEYSGHKEIKATWKIILKVGRHQ